MSRIWLVLVMCLAALGLSRGEWRADTHGLAMLEETKLLSLDARPSAQLCPSCSQTPSVKMNRKFLPTNTVLVPLRARRDDGKLAGPPCQRCVADSETRYALLHKPADPPKQRMQERDQASFTLHPLALVRRCVSLVLLRLLKAAAELRWASSKSTLLLARVVGHLISQYLEDDEAKSRPGTWWQRVTSSSHLLYMREAALMGLLEHVDCPVEKERRELDVDAICGRTLRLCGQDAVRSLVSQLSGSLRVSLGLLNTALLCLSFVGVKVAGGRYTVTETSVNVNGMFCQGLGEVGGGGHDNPLPSIFGRRDDDEMCALHALLDVPFNLVDSLLGMQGILSASGRCAVKDELVIQAARRGARLEGHSLGTLDARLMKASMGWAGPVVLLAPPFPGGWEAGVQTVCAHSDPVCFGPAAPVLGLAKEVHRIPGRGIGIVHSRRRYKDYLRSLTSWDAKDGEVSTQMTSSWQMSFMMLPGRLLEWLLGSLSWNLSSSAVARRL